MIIRLVLGLLLVVAHVARAAERLEIVWPTPNPAWANGKPLGDYIQHAGSGAPESGLFGGVRNGGTQFHEGIDIKCLTRDLYRVSASNQGRRFVLMINGEAVGARLIDGPLSGGVLFVFAEVPDDALPALVANLKKTSADLQRALAKKK